ncbi:MAG: discoidin domain-containing protein [Flavisolibacter sp.]
MKAKVLLLGIKNNGFMRLSPALSSIRFIIHIFLIGIFHSAIAQQSIPIVIQYDAGLPLNVVSPKSTLGAAFDGHGQGENDLILQPQNLQAMISTGLHPLTYRLRTELGNEIWHWNPKGSWSEPEKQQGYWTSSSDTSQLISLSYGYRLPRRGNTSDQANNDGYSRISDGDRSSFWKSNPYLDEQTTAEKSHAQWMVVDLGKEEWINAVEVEWGAPYAKEFTVDYASTDLYGYFVHFGYFEIDSPVLWKPFPVGTFEYDGKDQPVLRLSDRLVRVRFLRIHMAVSSHTALPGSHDLRDSLGFSIREIQVGKIDKQGRFTDLIHHSTNAAKQSKVYVSSTDSWHRAKDIDSLTEQVGIDRLYRSGLTASQPMLVPGGLLYDTPENVVALLDYLHKRNYPVLGMELGEEPDGQMISPEDFGWLYHYWSGRISSRYPKIALGGPSLQAIILDQNEERFSTRLWMQRLMHYLKQHDEQNFRFFSFEWYPYDDICAPSAPQLAAHPQMIEKAMKDLRSIEGIKDLPFYISEYGYSAFGGLAEVSIQGALMNADIVGQFLNLGGDKAFLYGLEPNQVQTDFGCAAGNNMLFGMDDDGKIKFKTATYYGALLMKQWMDANTSVEIYPVTTSLYNKNGEALISAYALHWKNNWSLMLINKDPAKSYTVRVQLNDIANKNIKDLGEPLSCYQYSGKQYQWHSNGLKGHPTRELPPEKLVLHSGTLRLPPYSLTLLKW